MVRRARPLSFRSRVLAALLTVIAISETVLAVSFYDQQRQHSTSASPVSVAERMHQIGDLELGVAQLVLQADPQRDVRSTCDAHDPGIPREPVASRAPGTQRQLAGSLDRRVTSLARTRGQFDRLPLNSPTLTVVDPSSGPALADLTPDGRHRGGEGWPEQAGWP